MQINKIFLVVLLFNSAAVFAMDEQDVAAVGRFKELKSLVEQKDFGAGGLVSNDSRVTGSLDGIKVWNEDRTRSHALQSEGPITSMAASQNYVFARLKKGDVEVFNRNDGSSRLLSSKHHVYDLAAYERVVNEIGLLGWAMSDPYTYYNDFVEALHEFEFMKKEECIDPAFKELWFERYEEVLKGQFTGWNKPKTYGGHRATISSVCMVGDRIVSGDSAGKVVMRDMEKGAEELSVGGAPCSVASVSGGKVVYVNDLCIMVADGYEGVKNRILDRFTRCEWCSSVATQGNKVAIGLESGKVKVFDLARNNELLELEKHPDLVNSLAMYKGKLVSGSHDGEVRVCDLEDGSLLNRMSARGRVTALAFWRNKVVIGLASGKLKVWDIMSDEVIPLKGQHIAIVNAIAIDHKSGMAVSGGMDGGVRIWDLVNSGSSDNSRRGFKVHAGSVNAVAIRGDKVVTGSSDRTVRVWDISLLKRRVSLGTLQQAKEQMQEAGVIGLFE
ncbi:MAG TPA: hypothetical protein QGF02_02575 [Candidatus Babeliales bacterium]|nr:hypothetical protein [Candidatus Babeliales bacterium]